MSDPSPSIKSKGEVREEVSSIDSDALQLVKIHCCPQHSRGRNPKWG